MASITVKNIPGPIYELLKAKAKRNNRSLNSEIISGLQRYIFQGNRDAKHYLEMAKKFQSMAKGSLTAEEIDQAKREGRE